MAALLACCGGKMGRDGEHTDSMVLELVESGYAPAISHTVVTANEVVSSTHAGVLDAGSSTAANAATMFMACSTTKVITAIAVMQLVERGKLALDRPLSEYIEHPFGAQVTIAGLLAHTSGVPDPMPLDWFFVEGEPRDHQAAYENVISGAKQVSDGPAKYGYSNVGYWLLGRAIEQVTESTFEDYVTLNIFEPLGIDARAASFELPPARLLATGHIRKWGVRNALFFVLAPSRYWSTSRRGWSRFERLIHHGPAYGGLYVSTEAFAAVLRDLLRDEPRLLSAASETLMFAPQPGTDGKGTLGWVVGETEGARYFGKQGGAVGFHGNVRVYPDLGIATVFFANSTRVTTGPIDRTSDALDAPFLRSQTHEAR